MGTLDTLNVMVGRGLAALPDAAWDVKNVLKNLRSWLGDTGSLVVGVLGFAMIIAAGFLIAMKLMSPNGKIAQGTNWVMVGAMLIVGGAFASAGLGLLMDISSGGETTIREIGEGLILPFQLLT